MESMRFKLCLMETQAWFEDEKRTKHNILSPFLISKLKLTMFGMVSGLSEQKRKLMLSVCFQSSLAAFLCKLCELILSIRFKDLKNSIHLPTRRPSPRRNQDRSC